MCFWCIWALKNSDPGALRGPFRKLWLPLLKISFSSALLGFLECPTKPFATLNIPSWHEEVQSPGPCRRSRLMSSRFGCSGMCQVLPDSFFFFLFGSFWGKAASFCLCNKWGQLHVEAVPFQVLKISPNCVGVSCDSFWRWEPSSAEVHRNLLLTLMFP